MIDIPQNALAAVCRKHHVRWLALFGSALRDDFGPDSDIDLLYELEPGATMGWEVIDLRDDLSAVFSGRPVDLMAPQSVKPHIRDRVISSAQTIYEAEHVPA